MQISQTQSKSPPHNAEAEQAALCSMLMNKTALMQGISGLDTEMFYSNAHKAIFSAIATLFSKKDTVDLVSVMNQLNTAGKLEEAGGAAYLANLTSQISSSSINTYIKIIKDTSIARQMIDAAREVIEDCYSGSPIEDVTSKAGTAFLRSVKQDTDQSMHISQIVNDEMKRLYAIENGEIDPVGIMSGFVDLDKLLNGFQNSDLIILAGRPSMGKTTLAMNMVLNAAQKSSKCLVFSLEMSKGKLVQNQISSLSGVGNKAVQRGYLNQPTWKKIEAAAKCLQNLPIRIDDSSALHIAQIHARAKMFAMTEGVDLIAIDYLQLAQGYSKNNREREISEISAGLKSLAKDLNVPVIALSQLSRKCEERTDKRPLMSDLRDSGSIEQDADVIAFVYRDDVYNKEESNPLKGIAEIIIKKHRCGEQGSIKLLFNGQNCRFENLAHQA